MNMFVVILNYWAIQLADNPLDIVMNFLALVVVSEIDDYFFVSHRDIICKDIIENLESDWSYLFKIQTTTSTDARPWEKNPEVNLMEKPRDVEWIDLMKAREQDTKLPQYLRIEFSERSLSNKICRVIYCCFRILYVTLWFYYLPYLSIIFEFWLTHSAEVVRVDPENVVV